MAKSARARLLAIAAPRVVIAAPAATTAMPDVRQRSAIVLLAALLFPQMEVVVPTGRPARAQHLALAALQMVIAVQAAIIVMLAARLHLVLVMLKVPTSRPMGAVVRMARHARGLRLATAALRVGTAAKVAITATLVAKHHSALVVLAVPPSRQTAAVVLMARHAPAQPLETAARRAITVAQPPATAEPDAKPALEPVLPPPPTTYRPTAPVIPTARRARARPLETAAPPAAIVAMTLPTVVPGASQHLVPAPAVPAPYQRMVYAELRTVRPVWDPVLGTVVRQWAAVAVPELIAAKGGKFLLLCVATKF